MALGKHLVQAVPFVYALQCLTGKVDNNNVLLGRVWVQGTTAKVLIIIDLKVTRAYKSML